MAITVTIAGTNRSSVTMFSSLKVQMGLESKWTCDFDVRDRLNTVAAYRPTLGQTVLISDGAITYFRGIIRRVVDMPLLDTNVGTLVKVHATSLSDVVDQRVVDKEYPEGTTFLAVVTDLRTTYLAADGIVLGTVTSTLALQKQTYKGVTLREVLNHLQMITGFVWRIRPTSTAAALDFFAAGAVAASYSLTATNGLARSGVVWEQERDSYVNTVYLRYGSEQQVNKIDTFTGTASGTETTFPLTYPALLNSDGHIISQGYVIENGGYNPINAAVWSYNAGTNSLVRVADLPTGSVASFNYVVQFPLTLTVSNAAEVAANGVFAATYEAPNIYDLGPANELAAGLLRNGVADPKIVRIESRQGLEFPGTVMTLTFTARTISGTYLIRDTLMTVDADQRAHFAFTFIEGSEHQASWTDRMRQAVGRGGANAPGGTIEGGVIPNFSGRFDEDVVAHTGKAQQEVIMGFIGAEGSYASGPGILVNRNPDVGNLRGSWAMVVDQSSGAQALMFQDRSVTAVGPYTLRTYKLSPTEYTTHASTGITYNLGQNANRLGHVISERVTVGPAMTASGQQLAVVDATIPIIDISEAGAAANLKNWRHVVFAQVYQIQSLNDAYTASTTIFSIDRAGNAAVVGQMVMSHPVMTDGIAAPPATPGYARIYVDAADGDLKVRFGDGVTKTIATDT